MDSIVHTALHVGATILFMWWMIFKIYLPRKTDPSTPSELTTCGILGTFTGIFLGLVPFVASGGADTSKHIPGLIGGIAVATVCSITGMFLALRAKSVFRAARLSEAAAAEEMHTGATADTLASY